MKLQAAVIGCVFSTVTFLSIPPKVAKAQRCWVQWQVNNPLVICAKPETDIFTSPSYIPGKKIVFNSQCRHPLKLAVRIQDTTDNWVTLGWWTLPSRQSLVLATDVRDIKTRSANFYLYAESIDGSNYRRSGNHLSTFGDRILKMSEQTFSLNADGDFTHTIDCRIRR
ncbi:MAG: DUF1036 domain-containing protein [Symploca sp. SIO2G7]|nr:DUF1036 domain-containing protein [Symploca sp. SIO2G7]